MTARRFRSNINGLILAQLLVLPAVSSAAEGSGGIDGVTAAVGIMALTNSTKQGGQGTAGSTILTETDVTYHMGNWGMGAFFQYDRQGNSEIDTALGPRIEGTLNPFYVEIGYALMMNRSFTDRAIAEQTGNSFFIGLGTRFQVGSGGWFIQSTYKYRTQTIEEQDGEPLDEPITQIDGYPLFGLGAEF